MKWEGQLFVFIELTDNETEQVKMVMVKECSFLNEIICNRKKVNMNWQIDATTVGEIQIHNSPKKICGSKKATCLSFLGKI